MIKWFSVALCLVVVLFRDQFSALIYGRNASCKCKNSDTATTNAIASETKRYLVIGYAYDLPLETLHYFVNPLQHYTTPQVDTALFVNKNFKYDAHSLTFLKPQNVFLIPTDQPASENVYTYRFRVILQWLTQNHAKYDKIVMTDTRDIYFQGDPFQQIQSAGIYVFEERMRHHIMLEVYQRWIGDCYGKAYVDRILSTEPQILSVGVVMGSTPEMMSYLRLMNEELEALGRVPKCLQATIELYKKPGFGVDTAAHLYLLKEKLVLANRSNHDEGLLSKKKGKVHFIPFRRGLVLHACMLPPEEHFEIDSMGRFLNDDGQPYAMIHQYDRYAKTFVALYKAKFPYLSRKRSVSITKDGFVYVGVNATKT